MELVILGAVLALLVSVVRSYRHAKSFLNWWRARVRVDIDEAIAAFRGAIDTWESSKRRLETSPEDTIELPNVQVVILDSPDIETFLVARSAVIPERALTRLFQINMLLTKSFDLFSGHVRELLTGFAAQTVDPDTARGLCIAAVSTYADLVSRLERVRALLDELDTIWFFTSDAP